LIELGTVRDAALLLDAVSVAFRRKGYTHPTFVPYLIHIPQKVSVCRTEFWKDLFSLMEKDLALREFGVQKDQLDYQLSQELR
jgi:hypothetical protein